MTTMIDLARRSPSVLADMEHAFSEYVSRLAAEIKARRDANGGVYPTLSPYRYVSELQRENDEITKDREEERMHGWAMR